MPPPGPAANAAPMTDTPQTYLVSPPDPGPDFAGDLARLLDTAEIACVRLDLATRDEGRLTRLSDTAREVCHARDVACVLSDHPALAQRLGLDGVHWRGPAAHLRKLRAEIGPDAILGAFCGTSRHDGMTAGELGADYVAFGPVGTTDLGTGARAEPDLFAWWSEMIELPIVAEGALDEAAIRQLAPVADWFALGEEVWRAADPAARLRQLQAAMAG